LIKYLFSILKIIIIKKIINKLKGNYLFSILKNINKIKKLEKKESTVTEQGS